MSDFTLFEIIYDQSELPAPYSHIFHITGKPQKNELYINFKVTYVDREELSEEEIYDEGFSTDDDFEWNGTLKPVWLTVMKNALQDIKFQNKKTSEIEVKVENNSGVIHKGLIDKSHEAAYIIEELIQAVYANTEKHIPLTVKYLKIKEGSSSLLEITPDFKNREVLLKANGTAHKNTFVWNDLKEFFQKLYSLDYNYEEALEDTPKETGVFLDPGESLWFKINKGVRSAHKTKTLQELTADLDKLFLN
ncbi:MAG: hypothetical protein ACK4ND_16880 [Cytophagaceae bacterium]